MAVLQAQSGCRSRMLAEILSHTLLPVPWNCEHPLGSSSQRNEVPRNWVEDVSVTWAKIQRPGVGGRKARQDLNIPLAVSLTKSGGRAPKTCIFPFDFVRTIAYRIIP